MKQHRFIYAGKRYDELDWNNLGEVVEAFHWKINEWYLVPANGILRAGFDQAFALMGLTCLLTDTLSQYYFGKPKSSQTTFKDFLKATIPSFAAQLSQPIEYTNLRGKVDKLETYADVMYVGFRCGILHECHVPLYGGLAGQDQLHGHMFDVDPDICTKYDDGRDCPTVRMDPTMIYPAVKTVFDTYSENLLDPNSAFDGRRDLFKIKFSVSFGVDVTNATL